MKPQHTTTLPAESILAINGGSSSIKFACFRTDDPLERWLNGSLDRIGESRSSLTFHDVAWDQRGSCSVVAADYPAASEFLLDWLAKRMGGTSLRAVGHRVVHGMNHLTPLPVTPELLAELHWISPCDPDHLPQEVGLIRACQQRFPQVPQIACFDTAFHVGMPRVARLLPLPRRFDALGVQRYGFHGLSYAYLMEELARTAGAEAAQGRVILAHLGNGASLAAVREGRSLDTSMGFTPAGGLPMGTRPGDLDPGITSYLLSAQGLTAKQFNHLIHHECGLLGVSETSSDMRDLLETQAGDLRAAEAVELFCYQTRKWIGAFTAVLGGLDTLLFSGGIGENASEVRARVCEGLRFLGIELDEAGNAASRPVISTEASRVSVRVIRTDEEQMIARQVRRLLLRDDEQSRGIVP